MQQAGLSERVQIESGDLTALQFADGSFDAAVSAHAVDHLGPLTGKGLREIRRALKPGGRFLLIVWIPNWTRFSIANVLPLFLVRKRAWRKMTAEAGFTLADEGMFDG